MTIRKTLLVAFLVAGLAPAILLASLAFVKAREALQTEIERSMSVEAAAIGGELDKMMFERLQNVAIWSRLDIMQDLQVHDVDKRLSRFLADLKTGYRGVYENLSCLDRDGRIISSSNAALVDTQAGAEKPWLLTTLSGTRLALHLHAGRPVPVVSIDAAIPSEFGKGDLGTLRLQLDWSEIDNMLDQSSIRGRRMLALLDANGRLIAASSNLRARGLLLSTALADWRLHRDTVVSRNGNPVVDARVLVGSARSGGYGQFKGFGWTTLIVQTENQAFAPVHRMAAIFIAILGLIAVVTVFAASSISKAIARPVVALTRFARGYMRNKILQVPATGGSGEIGELTDAFVQMVRDIDRSQQNLVRASKLAVVGEMSSIIAHEVRTPLGILRSSAQMLKREAAISDEGRELVGFIEGETERLNRLVSAMLDTARAREPVFASVDVHQIIRRCIAMLGAQANNKKVEVSAQLDAIDAQLQADEEQLTQVVLNLLMNGLQILHHGGRIRIVTRDDGDWLTIEIADDGPGIDPAERTRVFEAFFFKREGGIGLGLAVVQQIVNAHGGDIEVDNSELGGALFRISLPRGKPE